MSVRVLHFLSWAVGTINIIKKTAKLIFSRNLQPAFHYVALNSKRRLRESRNRFETFAGVLGFFPWATEHHARVAEILKTFAEKLLNSFSFTAALSLYAASGVPQGLGSDAWTLNAPKNSEKLTFWKHLQIESGTILLTPAGQKSGWSLKTRRFEGVATTRDRLDIKIIILSNAGRMGASRDPYLGSIFSQNGRPAFLWRVSRH